MDACFDATRAYSLVVDRTSGSNARTSPQKHLTAHSLGDHTVVGAADRCLRSYLLGKRSRVNCRRCGISRRPS